MQLVNLFLNLWSYYLLFYSSLDFLWSTVWALSQQNSVLLLMSPSYYCLLPGDYKVCKNVSIDRAETDWRPSRVFMSHYVHLLLLLIRNTFLQYNWTISLCSLKTFLAMKSALKCSTQMTHLLTPFWMLVHIWIQPSLSQYNCLCLTKSTSTVFHTDSTRDRCIYSFNIHYYSSARNTKDLYLPKYQSKFHSEKLGIFLKILSVANFCLSFLLMC